MAEILQKIRSYKTRTLWRNGKAILGWQKEFDKKLVCDYCEKVLDPETYQWREVHDRPFSDDSRIARYCGDDCQQAGLFDRGDFNYFDCDACGRTVCEQNPSNGWHTQYRTLDDGDNEKVCLRCYEKIILDEGIPREKFENREIAGTFFSRGNFEPLKAGYTVDELYQDFNIRSQNSIDSYCQRALELIDKGYKVVTGYENLAIGGLEGYVTLFYKPVQETKTIGELGSRTDLTAVQVDVEVAQILADIGVPVSDDDKYNFLLVKIVDGDYKEVWGCSGVPYVTKIAVKLK